MNASLCWNCDFCGKPGITVSSAGILYCQFCRMSYGEQINLNILKPIKELIEH